MGSVTHGSNEKFATEQMEGAFLKANRLELMKRHAAKVGPNEQPRVGEQVTIQLRVLQRLVPLLQTLERIEVEIGTGKRKTKTETETEIEHVTKAKVNLVIETEIEHVPKAKVNLEHVPKAKVNLVLEVRRVSRTVRSKNFAPWK